MAIRPITDLEVIDIDTEITGSENVLIEKNGVAKLVPMNMIKASGDGISGGYVIDTTADDFEANCSDTAYGDAILELVRNGTPLSVYYLPDSSSSSAVEDISYYSIVTGCIIVDGIDKPKVRLYYYNNITNSNDDIEFYITAGE